MYVNSKFICRTAIDAAIATVAYDSTLHWAKGLASLVEWHAPFPPVSSSALT